MDRGFIITNTAKIIDLEMAIAEYMRRETRSSGNTWRAKTLDLQTLRSYFESVIGECPALVDITRGSIEDYVEYRLSIEAPSTVARRLATVKHFCRIMAEAFTDFKSPARGISTPRIDKTEPPRLTDDEKQRLRDAALQPVRFEIAMRNLLIIELGLMQGLRCAEIAGLQLKNMQGGLIQHFRGKGARFSTVPMHSKVRQLVAQYNSLRDALLTERFPTYHQLSDKEKLAFPYLLSFTCAKIERPQTFAMNSKTVWRVVKEAGKRAGVKVWTHKLRHTAIKDFYAASKNDIFRTAKYARHKNVNTTMLYAESSTDEISQTMEAM